MGGAQDRTGEAALLAQIYAASDDDIPRLVYAACKSETIRAATSKDFREGPS